MTEPHVVWTYRPDVEVVPVATYVINTGDPSTWPPGVTVSYDEFGHIEIRDAT